MSCSKDKSNEENKSIIKPEVSLDQVEIIASTAVRVNATITNAGDSPISAKGFCWNTSPNPTIDDNSSNQGNGSSSFTNIISTIIPGTLYYVRAYATNDSGTAYSSESTFETATPCDQNTYTEQVILTTQQEVNDFGDLSICKLTSDLFIRAPQGGTLNPIVDLSPLSSLEIIEGGLYLKDLTELESLQGLENLQQVRKALYVDHTSKLENLDALSNLTGEITELVVSQNQVLKNIDGLSGLTSFVDGEFGQDPQIAFSFNPLLENINGIANVTSLGDGDGSTFGLLSNPKIYEIDAVSGFSQDIDRVIISFNNHLWSLNGLQGLSICKEFYLGYNVISDYSGLQNLSSITLNMEISGTGTTTLDFLENLEFVGGNLKFADNPTLFDYCGLQNLIDLNGLHGSFITENNFYNPTYQDMLDGNCSF